MQTLRALAVAVFAAGTVSAAIDPGLLNLAMPDAKVLSGMQVDQSLSSPFGQYLLSQMQPNDPGFLNFISATGFDPRHDLHEILAATPGDGSNPGGGGIVAGRGTFQPAQVIAAAGAKGAAISQYRGVTVITSPRQGSGSVAFLDSTLAVMGTLSSVQGAIDRQLASAAFTGPLAAKAQDASASNQAWFATVTPLSDFLNGKVSNPNLNNLSQNNLFQSIMQTSGGINLASGGVTISADAVTSSAQNAQALVDVLKFLVSMVPANNPELKSLASASTFTVNGVTAHITLALTEDQAEQLFANHPHKTASAQQN